MRPGHDLGPKDPRFNIVCHAKGPMFSFNKKPGKGEPTGPKNTIRCWVDTIGKISKGTLFTKRNEWKAGVWYHLACTYDEKELVLYEKAWKEDYKHTAGTPNQQSIIEIRGR